MDRREDAGDFYPGGKVISTRPVATGGDVKHSDFAGLDVKTNTIPDLREAVRELGRRLGATVVTALSACVALGATVQTAKFNDLDFDTDPSFVTNVVFDAAPDFSTNNTELVETIEATAPAPGDYAVVSNAAMNAVQTETDPVWNAEKSGYATKDDVETLTAKDIELGQQIDLSDHINIQKFNQINEDLAAMNDVLQFDSAPTEGSRRIVTSHGIKTAIDNAAPGNYAAVSNAAVHAAITNALQDAELESHASQLSQLSQSLDGKVPTSRTINGKALTSNISLSADEVGATTPADVTAAIREQSLGGIWDAELEVWWTPRMRNGNLTYEATTNVNLNAEN